MLAPPRGGHAPIMRDTLHTQLLDALELLHTGAFVHADAHGGRVTDHPHAGSTQAALLYVTRLDGGRVQHHDYVRDEVQSFSSVRTFQAYAARQFDGVDRAGDPVWRAMNEDEQEALERTLHCATPLWPPSGATSRVWSDLRW